MLRLLAFLIDGCWHEYEALNVQPVDHYDLSFRRQAFMYRALPCRCRKCGKLSQWKDRSGAARIAQKGGE